MYQITRMPGVPAVKSDNWSHKSVNCDRPGECCPGKDCLRWHWLTLRQPERKSSSESSELWIFSTCYKSLVVVLIGRRTRDVIGRLSVKPWCYWLHANNIKKELKKERKKTKKVLQPAHLSIELWSTHLRSYTKLTYLKIWRHFLKMAARLFDTHSAK